MSQQECLQVLARARLARLACARENQPYVVPVYLAYHEASGCLYGFTTPGQKVEWMRANPLVCVEVDEITDYDQWASVIVMGKYEESPDSATSEGARHRTLERQGPVDEVTLARSASDSRHCLCDANEYIDDQDRAWHMLSTHPVWEEPGFTAWASRAHHNAAEPFISVYYRIRIHRITGHEATPDARDASSHDLPTEKQGWLPRTLMRVFGSKRILDLTARR